MSIYDDPKIQDLAKTRANKLWKRLLDPKNFAPIMKSIDPKRDKKAFDTACANAKLEPEEADWLWNYLDKGCDKAIYGKTKVRDNPPFASSGW